MFHLPNGNWRRLQQNRQNIARATKQSIERDQAGYRVRAHTHNKIGNKIGANKANNRHKLSKRKDTECIKTCFVSQFRCFLVFFTFSLHIALILHRSLCLPFFVPFGSVFVFVTIKLCSIFMCKFYWMK